MISSAHIWGEYMITYNPDNPQLVDQIALDSNTLLAWFKANLKEKEEAEETLKM